MGTLKHIAPPAYISNSAANIYTPPNAAVDTVIRHIRVVNTDSSARTFSLYVGATGGSAGGTEIEKDRSVAVGVPCDIYFSPGKRLSSTQFLSGIASVASKLVITVDGEYIAN
jgi:hypothetical protein